MSALKRTYDSISLMGKDDLGVGKKTFDTGTHWVVLFEDEKMLKRVEELVQSSPVLFTSLVGTTSTTRRVNFRPLNTDKLSNDKDEVQIPISFVLQLSSRFDNNLFRYFIGKRVAFLVVENYVRNAWKKYGIVHSMMNSKGLVFLKFSVV